MTEQIHKRLIEEQVRIILDRYIKKEISVLQAMNLLDLKRRQFDDKTVINLNGLKDIKNKVCISVLNISRVTNIGRLANLLKKTFSKN